jgi:hypothetical protein
MNSDIIALPQLRVLKWSKLPHVKGLWNLSKPGKFLGFLVYILECKFQATVHSSFVRDLSILRKNS